MPGSFQSNAGFGIPNVPQSMPIVRTKESGNVPYVEYGYTLAGITRSAGGGLLGLCAVVVFRTVGNSVAAQTTSDASGNYLVPASNSLNHYVVAYLPGSPDVAGTTRNDLVGA